MSRTANFSALLWTVRQWWMMEMSEDVPPTRSMLWLYFFFHQEIEKFISRRTWSHQDMKCASQSKLTTTNECARCKIFNTHSHVVSVFYSPSFLGLDCGRTVKNSSILYWNIWFTVLFFTIICNNMDWNKILEFLCKNLMATFFTWHEWSIRELGMTEGRMWVGDRCLRREEKNV